MKVNNTGALSKITPRSNGGYITDGFDSNYKKQLICWDNAFNPLWKYKFPDANLTPFGNFSVEANDGSVFTMCQSSQNGGCVFIAKFNSSGAMLWQKVYYLTGNQNLQTTCISKGAGNDNGFLFGTGQCALSNCVIKCDSSGNIEWQKQYHYPLAGGVITCWSILPESNGYVVSSSYNINSLLTIKINMSGVTQSHTAYTYTGMQIVPTRIIKTATGYAIVGNYNNTNNNKTEFVAIYDNALTLTSFNELTVTYTQFTLTDIAAINGGQTLVVNGNMYDNSKFYSAILSMNLNGNVGWKHLSEGNTATGNKNVQFDGICAWGNRTINVGTGYNEGAVLAVIDSLGNGLCNTLPFNMTNVPKVLTLQNSQVIELPASILINTAPNYTYNTSVSVNKSTYCGGLVIPNSVEVISEESGIEIYPNPVDNQLVITSKQAINLKIVSLNGNIMYEKSDCSHQQIATHNWASGLYFAIIDANKQKYFRKLLVVH